MQSRRFFMLGALAAGFTGTYPRVVRASQARAIGLSELVHTSRHAVLATPITMDSQWERIGGRRRIVTYSTVQVHQPLDGRAPSADELTVRTLGGRVGDIGQIVHGEAVLRVGKIGALFLREMGAQTFSITAMAQGHFPLIADSEGRSRLRRGARLEELVGTDGAAVRVLHDRLVPDAERLIVEELHRDGK